MNTKRMQVFPTRANWKLLSVKLASAQNGQNLLKTKEKALQTLLEEAKNKNNRNKIKYMEKQAKTRLFKAEYYGAGILSFAKRCEKENAQVERRITHVCGVGKPMFRLIRTGEEAQVEGRCGKRLLEIKLTARELLGELIQAAENASLIKSVETELQITKRRLNALEHVIIPQLENTLKFINDELEEHEREEFFRMKKVQYAKN